MELRRRNKLTNEIGVAFVTDSDAGVLKTVGYYHCVEKDFIDNFDGELIEIWKPCGGN